MWLAELDERPVGYARAYRYIGEYHPRKWNLTVGVEANSRGQGIGRLLNEVAEKFVIEKEPISIATRVSEDNDIALDYALRLGYREVKRDFESILHLGKLVIKAMDPGPIAGVNIICATEFNHPAGRKEWHALFEVVRLDVPRVEPPVRLSLEEFEHYVLDDPEFLWAASFIALAEGRMIGFSGLYRAPAEGLADQWLTAVHKNFRGRGIARALKAAATRRAIEMGFWRIRTNNDTRNTAMLAINDGMGYERLPGTITLVRRVAPDEDI
jgi:mycothiol synthase